MPEAKEKPSLGGYLNHTYLLLGSIASLIAIATGYIALREHNAAQPAPTPPASNSTPVVQLQLPALPATQPGLPEIGPPKAPPGFPPPLPLPGPPGK